MSFEIIRREGLECLVYRPWLERGIEHGFSTVCCDFREERLAENLDVLRSALGLEAIILPSQVHGHDCLEIADGERLNTLMEEAGSGSGLIKSMSADSVLLRREAAGSRESPGSLAIGVRVADCVPILLFCRKWIAAIHAGWRGLAAGVIENTLNCAGLAGGDKVEAVIGPCAGSLRYEVGQEVIDLLGRRAVFEKLNGKQRFRLDLASSAEKALREAGVSGVANSSICSISSPDFSSYRRDGQKSGRGLAFISWRASGTAVLKPVA